MTGLVGIAHFQETHRLLRRYQSGRCSEIRLSLSLERAINQVGTSIVRMRPALKGLTWNVSPTIARCDELIDLAQRAHLRKEFNRGLDEIRKAQFLILELEELLATWEEYRLATKACTELLALINSGFLEQLTSIRTITGLMSEAQKFLTEGRCGQARFMTRICRSKLDALKEVRRDLTSQQARLQTQIAEHTAFCTQTEGFARSPIDDDLRCALERLQQLLELGHVLLVVHLRRDIEVQLASRAAVLKSLNHYGDLVGRNSLEAKEMNTRIKRMITSESWESACSYLLEQLLNLIGRDANQLSMLAKTTSDAFDRFIGTSSNGKNDVGLATN